MAYSDHNASEDVDESADTASFQRFVEREGGTETGPTSDGRNFRLLSLAIGAIVLIALVVLLMQ